MNELTNIIPMPGKVWILPDTVEAAGYDTSSLDLSAEGGIVVAYSPREGISMPPELKVGAYVYVKDWGNDTVELEGKKYYVTDVEFKAIAGIKKIRKR